MCVRLNLTLPSRLEALDRCREDKGQGLLENE